MPSKILCVAEKPAIARAVADHLSGGRFNTRNGGGTYCKNFEFDFDFGRQWGHCHVTVTSVIGHITTTDFPPHCRSWEQTPLLSLFDERIVESIAEDKKSIADNITKEARHAQALFIWTDCDLEGEFIGAEVRQCAFKSNPRMEVKRARFSNTERAHVRHAAMNPIDLDERKVNAVATRIELDFRVGACMTRFQTLKLRTLGPMYQQTISYGPCQFPTLGFVVDRYLRVRAFKPETFWAINVIHKRDDISVKFLWDRNHLFDRAVVTILFERCLAARYAVITKLETKPTSKWKPLPLTTVELQKLGSMFLRMDSSRVMKVAEDLYTKGWISYPRTETDQFDAGMDLRALVGKQTPDSRWGQYAQSLLDGGFQQPRSGRNNDQAHPPIHPVNYVTSTTLGEDERKVYEFVVRRFLGACSEDAKGQTTTVNVQYGPETFHATGLVVLERNYLEVYTYDRWTSSQQIPKFAVNERFEPMEANMTTGKTSPPHYITEPELIALMDVNGIGTDATMAEHISTIQSRNYAGTQLRGSVKEFIPTPLGVGLIEAYETVGMETSLSKPFLRRELETKMKAICDGTKQKQDVVLETIQQYQNMFIHAQRNVSTLLSVVQRVVDHARMHAGPAPIQQVAAVPNTTSRTTRGGRGSTRGTTRRVSRAGSSTRGSTRARSRTRARTSSRGRSRGRG